MVRTAGGAPHLHMSGCDVQLGRWMPQTRDMKLMLGGHDLTCTEVRHECAEVRLDSIQGRGTRVNG